MEQTNKLKKTGKVNIRKVPVAFGNHGLKLKGKILLPAEAGSDKLVPGAVVCHGFGSDQRAVEKSAEMLAAEGIATIIFDFRGHGASEGAVDDKIVDDAVDAWDTLKNFPGVDNNRMGLIGHSLGALSAVMAAGRVGNPRVLVALNCPPKVDKKLVESTLPSYFGHWGRKENHILEFPRHGNIPWIKGIGSFLVRLYMFACGYHVSVNVQRFVLGVIKMNMDEVVKKLDGCSKLFVFCQSDTVTPYAQAVDIYESASYPKEKIVSRGHHATSISRGGLRSQWTLWTANALKS
jgi:pimeloyl-ACP methyl ester carboxylesterase